jgi:hypothetical protein
MSNLPINENIIKEKEVFLKLGDVILITDPINEILNDAVFFIDYIDSSKIRLINTGTFETTILSISSDGTIGDGTIDKIRILSSNKESGYARQNGLLPGNWIDIYFGGDLPMVITGKITNLEEDMIEVKTYDDNEIIYINFDYKGIPEDLPIVAFEIRPPPKGKEEEKEEEKESKKLEDEMIYIQEEEEDKIEEEIKPSQIKKQVKEMFIDLDEIQIGDAIVIEENYMIDRDKYRYNIDTQTNDLLEEMLSKIPSQQRTNNVLNNLHIIITRFLQLREMSSEFDENHNVIAVKNKYDNDIPLAEYLSKFKNRLYWILLVAKNIKKTYPSKEIIMDNEMNDTEDLEQGDVVKRLSTTYSHYYINKNKYEIEPIGDREERINIDPIAFNEIMRPFKQNILTQNTDAFANNNGVIIEEAITEDLNAIIDNLGDLYSTVVKHSKLTSQRFVIQRYNLSYRQLSPINIKGSNFITQRVKVNGTDDEIAVNGIVTLPEPAVTFSQINLPGSDLLVKANLNLHFLNYWQLLKKQTKVSQVVVDGLDNTLDYTESNFVDNIKHYIMNLTEYSKNESITHAEIYRQFLTTVIPKIKVLFSLVKKYIKGKMSLVNVVKYLEPFMIYPMDLTYTQYTEINAFIREKISEYTSKLKEYKNAFGMLKIDRTVQSRYMNALFSMALQPNKDINMSKAMLHTYGFDEDKHVSSSEFLKEILKADYGCYFNTTIALSNINLMYPSSLNTLLEADKDEIKEAISKSQNKCSEYVIAKKYYSKESLMNDNGRTIFFDKEYDTTNYEILNEKYKKQQNAMQTKDDFILFLSDEFEKNHKMDQRSAEYMARTLVEQAKEVRQGDYALLVLENDGYAQQMEYYIRDENDTWILDTNIDPKDFIKDSDVLCNLNLDCMYDVKQQDKCVTTDMSKDKVLQDSLKQVMDQFDQNYNISKDELNANLTAKLAHYKDTFEKLKVFKERQHLKYNEQKYNLGLTVAGETRNIISSPYANLRDLIMGQNDFIKRQHDIVKFVNAYCYQGDNTNPNIHDGEMENEWWYYCKQTNIKLLPRFHYMLAFTFINNNSKYNDVIEQLKKDIGKRSDDGDSWVDMHSGEVICYIDMDTSEGYSDGFANKGRDIIEKDISEVILEKQGNKEVKKRLSPEGEMISKMITTLSFNMGIDIEQSRDFIIKIVSELMADPTIMITEAAYKKKMAEMEKKGDKRASYALIHSTTILYLTLGTFLIAIQTNMPSIVTKKTAPGCVRSFVGFPFEGEGDDSSINYLACVALKSRDPTSIPWNAMNKDEVKVAANIKTFINKYLINNNDVQQRMKEKAEYLMFNKEERIPEEHDLTKWSTFLPPLQRFHIRSLEPITTQFIDSLEKDIQSGDYRQQDRLLAIESKIIAYSLAIQESIQTIVESKNLLMKTAGKFFMENACCNESTNKMLTSLQYFANEDNNIDKYNKAIQMLTTVIHDIRRLTNAKIMLSTENTKRTFPETLNDFNEETIYYAFIMFCKFQSSLPLSNDLASVCIDKPDYLKKMDSIQEKISKLKRDGRNYTVQQFLRLFQIVSRNNIINLPLNKHVRTCKDNLIKILEVIEEKKSKHLSPKLIDGLKYLIEDYDVYMDVDEGNPKSDEIKNYLQNSITDKKKELTQFIKGKASLTNIEYKNIELFLLTLNKWSYKNRNAEMKISDDSYYNIINFMRNVIEMVVILFPSMIMNNNPHDEFFSKPYWKFSDVHIADLQTYYRKYYAPINSFCGNDKIKNVLRAVSEKNKLIYLLSQNTPAFTEIINGETILSTVFDKQTTMLLYEYYLLTIFTDHISLSKNVTLVGKILAESNEPTYMSSDFIREQEMVLAEEENEYIKGEVLDLTIDIAKLMVSYIKIIMKSKKQINMSYDDVQDKVFRQKESEKYVFTDKLKKMTDEERDLDTTFKHLKLGIYSIGSSKGLREYDADHFEFDKQVAEDVAKAERKARKKNIDVDDAMYEDQIDREIAEDNYNEYNQEEDFYDGDPYGDERDDD